MGYSKENIPSGKRKNGYWTAPIQFGTGGFTVLLRSSNPRKFAAGGQMGDVGGTERKPFLPKDPLKNCLAVLFYKPNLHWWTGYKQYFYLTPVINNLGATEALLPEELLIKPDDYFLPKGRGIPKNGTYVVRWALPDQPKVKLPVLKFKVDFRPEGFEEYDKLHP